jgi:hypothetical protein
MPIGRAVDLLADQLNAHITILAELGAARVVVDLANRSPMDNLKSVLKGYSYAVIFNDPSHSYSSFEKPHPGAAVTPSVASGRSLPTSEMKPVAAGNDRPASRMKQARAQGGRRGTGRIHGRDATSARPQQPHHLSGGSVLSQESGTVGASAATDAADGQEGAIVENPDRSVAAGEQERLQYQIARIQEEIDSGAADAFYDRWSQIKDPRYIYSHYDELQRLQERLESLDD